MSLAKMHTTTHSDTVGQEYSITNRIPAKQRGAILVSFTAGLILFFNIGWTAWAIHRSWPAPSQGGILTLYTGSCYKVKSMGLWLHLTINIISTHILSL